MTGYTGPPLLDIRKSLYNVASKIGRAGTTLMLVAVAVVVVEIISVRGTSCVAMLVTVISWVIKVVMVCRIVDGTDMIAEPVDVYVMVVVVRGTGAVDVLSVIYEPLATWNI